MRRAAARVALLGPVVFALAVLALTASGARAQVAPPLPAAAEAWAWPDRAPLPSAPRDTLRARTEDWLSRDKALHVAGSFLLTLSAQYVLVNKAGRSEGAALPLAMGAALAVGVGKEIADAYRPAHPSFSVHDLAADALGVLLAAGLIAL